MTRRNAGYVLIPVLVAATLLAVIAALLTRESALTHDAVESRLHQTQMHLTTEAALNHMRWSLETANCTGYTALPATGFSAHNYSVTVTPTAGSPVDVTVAAALGSGETRSATFTDIAVHQPVAAVATQPGNAGVDGYVDANNTTSNHGAGSTLRIDQVTGNTLGLLRFDVSFLPPGTRIDKAQLELYVDANASTDAQAQVAVHRALTAWSEGTGDGAASGDGATYATADGVTAWSWATNHDSTPTAQAAIGSATGWQTWDITGLAAGWVSRNVANHGMVLKGNGFVNRLDFASSDSTTAANRPRLVIDYRFECGSGLAVRPQQILVSADTQLDGVNATFNYGGATALSVGDSDQQRSLQLVDTSAIGGGTNLLGATLHVYVNGVSGSGGAPAELTVHRVTTGWSEGSLTGTAPADGATWATYDGVNAWTAAGGDKAAAAETTVSVADGYTGWVALDITALAQGWINGTWTNSGLMLSNGTTKQIALASREQGAVDLRPYLFLRYQ